MLGAGQIEVLSNSRMPRCRTDNVDSERAADFAGPPEHQGFPQAGDGADAELDRRCSAGHSRRGDDERLAGPDQPATVRDADPDRPGRGSRRRRHRRRCRRSRPVPARPPVRRRPRSRRDLRRAAGPGSPPARPGRRSSSARDDAAAPIGPVGDATGPRPAPALPGRGSRVTRWWRVSVGRCVVLVVRRALCRW